MKFSDDGASQSAQRVSRTLPTNEIINKITTFRNLDLLQSSGKEGKVEKLPVVPLAELASDLEVILFII